MITVSLGNLDFNVNTDLKQLCQRLSKCVQNQFDL